MRDLKKYLENRDVLQTEETRLLRSTTIQQSLQQWLRLQKAFEWQLQQTAPIFEAERRAALIALQTRLQHLVD